MHLKIIISLMSLGLFASSAGATEYIYRDIMANSLPNAQCQTHDKAAEAAQRHYTLDRFSKKVCQTQGYGWHLDETQAIGETVCTPCPENPQLQKCFQKDITVSCKRIKPGTVGMLPGKG